ncbi:hypothetical protein AB0M72_03565 [Nocardiopsis dassonvillei]
MIPDQAPSARTLEHHRARWGHGFLPLGKFAEIPGRYGQEDVPHTEVTIHLHYIGPEAHWWIAEVWESREEPGTWEAYGYVSIYPGDAPEWSHISLTELARVSLAIPVRSVNPSAPCHHLANMRAYIERDLEWTPRPAHRCVPGLAPPQKRIDADPADQQGRRR